MNSEAWNQFILRVNIRIPIPAVYQAFATPKGLESWFLRTAKFMDAGGIGRRSDAILQVADRYEWFWHGYPDTVSEKGKILAANGKDRFAFSFSLDCPVSISLYLECGETIVELTESNLPRDEEAALKHFVGDSRGWIFYLANLKSVLEGGHDLRNRNPSLTNVITA